MQLPHGTGSDALTFPHFPTAQQTFLWRNWNLVPTSRLAAVLHTDEPTLTGAARLLGLPVPSRACDLWLERGYITILRNNWHLLPYGQLLELLGWDEERLDFVLREEDFLWTKLGGLKPHARPLRWNPLTEDDLARTAAIRGRITHHLPDLAAPLEDPPFAFLDHLAVPLHDVSVPREDDTIGLKLVYSYAALYGDLLAAPDSDPFPEGLLAGLAREGVNGVWLQGILYALCPWDEAPELSAACDTRLKALRRLIARCATYGIRVFLYLNEPRCLPIPFFERHPELKGVEFPQLGTATLCTSQPRVLAFIEQACTSLFEAAPGLGGVFTITMSENPTNCHSKGTGGDCPRCRDRDPAAVVAEVNTAIERGVHRASPRAEVIAWTWGWHPDWAAAAVERLPESVSLMCVSETGVPTRIGGIKGAVLDYSISNPGPGSLARDLWAAARKRGMKTVAKVQANNTWECCAVPYIPAMDAVSGHLAALRKAGVSGLMLSWTLGGYPSPNLGLLHGSIEELAVSIAGPEGAANTRHAWSAFSRALKQFPFHIGVLYRAPQNYGPGNLLFETPTGYASTMLGYPYDDLTGWRAIYPADVFEAQWELLSREWGEGCLLLEQANPHVPEDLRPRYEDMQTVARAVYCHFRSAYLQTAYVRERDADTPDPSRLEEILTEEISVAGELARLMRRDSRIGFEASNHYLYTLDGVAEKIINCEYLLERLRNQHRAGD